jgi:hypothetical protein
MVLFVFATTNIYFLAALLISGAFLFWRIVYLLTPNLQIAEFVPFVGITVIFMYCLGFIKAHKKMELIMVFALILNQSKFIFLAPFFFPISIIKSCEWIDSKTKKQELKGFIYKFVIGFSILLVIGYSVLSYEYPPTQGNAELVKFSVQYQKDSNLPLYNDWSLGWHTQFYGYQTKFKGSLPNPDYNYDFNYLALTRQPLDCKIIKTIEDYNLYKCP